MALHARQSRRRIEFVTRQELMGLEQTVARFTKDERRGAFRLKVLDNDVRDCKPAMGDRVTVRAMQYSGEGICRFIELSSGQRISANWCNDGKEDENYDNARKAWVAFRMFVKSYAGKFDYKLMFEDNKWGYREEIVRRPKDAFALVSYEELNKPRYDLNELQLICEELTKEDIQDIMSKVYVQNEEPLAPLSPGGEEIEPSSSSSSMTPSVTLEHLQERLTKRRVEELSKDLGGQMQRRFGEELPGGGWPDSYANTGKKRKR